MRRLRDEAESALRDVDDERAILVGTKGIEPLPGCTPAPNPNTNSNSNLNPTPHWKAGLRPCGSSWKRASPPPRGTASPTISLTTLTRHHARYDALDRVREAVKDARERAAALAEVTSPTKLDQSKQELERCLVLLRIPAKMLKARRDDDKAIFLPGMLEFKWAYAQETLLLAFDVLESYATIGIDLYELWEAQNRKTSFGTPLIALNEAMQFAYRVYEMLGGFNPTARACFLDLHQKLEIVVTVAEKAVEKKKKEREKKHAAKMHAAGGP